MVVASCTAYGQAEQRGADDFDRIGDRLVAGHVGLGAGSAGPVRCHPQESGRGQATHCDRRGIGIWGRDQFVPG